MSSPLEDEAEFNRTVDAQEEDLHRRNKAVRRRNIIMVIVAAVAVILALLCAWLAYDNDRLASANAQYGREQAQEKQIIAKEAQKALCGTKDREIYDPALCAKWAEVAEEPAPIAPAVANGPSQEELVKAFREYCSAGNCKGQDGASPTADDIAAAFVRFCSDGRCTGPAGKDAPPAKDGADGATGPSGATGPPPTAEMVLAAVTTYCSSGACVGAAGKDGPPPSAEAVLAAVQQVCANNAACQGPAGPAGPAGVAGQDGAPGPQGETGPAPSQFTFTWAGTTYTCTPNPPGSTTYACDPTSPPPPVIGVNP